MYRNLSILFVLFNNFQCRLERKLQSQALLESLHLPQANRSDNIPKTLQLSPRSLSRDSSIATIKHAMDLSSALFFLFFSCESLTMQSTIKATLRSKVSFISIDISRRRWFRILSLLSSKTSTKTSSSLIRCARLVLYW